MCFIIYLTEHTRHNDKPLNYNLVRYTYFFDRQMNSRLGYFDYYLYILNVAIYPIRWIAENEMINLNIMNILDIHIIFSGCGYMSIVE